MVTASKAMDLKKFGCVYLFTFFKLHMIFKIQESIEKNIMLITSATIIVKVL